jgi:hypothetical protein
MQNYRQLTAFLEEKPYHYGLTRLARLLLKHASAKSGVNALESLASNAAVAHF